MDEIPDRAQVSRLFRSLSLHQRLDLISGVRRGRVVSDPNLAPLAVAYARLQQELPAAFSSRWFAMYLDAGPMTPVIVAGIVLINAYVSGVTALVGSIAAGAVLLILLSIPARRVRLDRAA